MTGIAHNGEADAHTAAAILAVLGIAVAPVTIRVWAHRGKVRRVGKDGHGRTTYAFADIWRVATLRNADRV